MPFTDGKQYCPDCGREMKPLSQSFYCPNDCDRKPKEIQEERVTEKIIVPICPKCGSPDITPFSMYFWRGYRCIDCMNTWQ